MTYLQLCQRVHLLLKLGSRGNTAKAGTVPTSVSGQVDELAEIVEWVKRAWIEIQNEQRWGFAVTSGTLVFNATNTVTPTATLTTFAEWLPFVEGCGFDGSRQYALCYLTADGQTAEQPIYFEPYGEFRGYRDRANVATGRPLYFTIAPNRDWIVYPTPDASYTIRLNYRVAPQVWTSSDGALDPANYPTTGKGLPDYLQDCIVWRAIRSWAETRGDGNMFGVADKRYKEMLIPVKRMFLPHPRFA